MLFRLDVLAELVMVAGDPRPWRGGGRGIIGPRHGQAGRRHLAKA
ncbi:hypothetical protein [Nonomuraea sp. NPDC005650]